MATEILECGHPPTPQPEGSCTTGYGTDKNGKRHCFACCAERDRASMIEHGNGKRLPLYFTSDGNGKHEVSNWTGGLRFRVWLQSVTRMHGFGGVPYTRTHFRFDGPDGFVWSGYHAANSSQIAHCRRTKVKVRVG